MRALGYGNVPAMNERHLKPGKDRHMQRTLLTALTAALAIAFSPVALAIPVQINLTDDGLPLIPPAVAYTMGECAHACACSSPGHR